VELTLLPHYSQKLAAAATFVPQLEQNISTTKHISHHSSVINTLCNC